MHNNDGEFPGNKSYPHSQVARTEMIRIGLGKTGGWMFPICHVRPNVTIILILLVRDAAQNTVESVVILILKGL